MGNVRIMQSKDLLAWLDIDGVYLTLTDTEPDARQYKVTVPYAPTPRLFLRVESDCVPFEPEP